MPLSVQGSLLDLDDEPVFGELGDAVKRITLGLGAWLDVRPGWLTGSDTLFEHMRTAVPWQAERREMYDTVVDVPRLTRFYRTGEPLPLTLLDDARDRLSAHYRSELGDCAKTCECRVLGIDIKIPKDDLPSAGIGCADAK